MQLDRDAEALQELGGVGFGLPAVQLGEFGLEFAGAEAVFLGEVLLFVEGVLLLHDIVEVLVAHDDGVEDGVFVVLELILLEDGHARAGLEEDIAGRRLQLAGEHFQKGGFAGAVRADDAIAVAGCELQVDLLEQDAAAELHAEVGNCDHSLLLILIVPFSIAQFSGRVQQNRRKIMRGRKKNTQKREEGFSFGRLCCIILYHINYNQKRLDKEIIWRNGWNFCPA